MWASYLSTFERQFNFNIRSFRAQPEENVVPIVKDHAVVVSQIILAEIGTLFRDSEVTFLIRATEEASVTHVFSRFFVPFATADSDPKEVFRFFAFSNHLKEKKKLKYKTYKSFYLVGRVLVKRKTVFNGKKWSFYNNFVQETCGMDRSFLILFWITIK